MSQRSEIIRVIQEYFAGSKKISELTALPSNIQNSDLFEVARGGVSYKGTGSQLPSGSGVQGVTGTGVDNTDPTNPVIALANGLAAVDTTGTAISFAVPQIYGTDGAPETGNITIVTTGLVKGMCQLLIHNNGSEPTYGAEIKIISGAYATGELNYIMLLAVSSTLILVTISQEV